MKGEINSKEVILGANSKDTLALYDELPFKDEYESKLNEMYVEELG